MHLAGKGKGGNPDPHASWHCNKGGQTRKKRTSLKVHFLSFFLFACFWRGDAKESLEIVNGPRSEWRIRLTDLQSVHSSHTEFLPETKKNRNWRIPHRSSLLRTHIVCHGRERERRDLSLRVLNIFLFSPPPSDPPPPPTFARRGMRGILLIGI